MSLWHDHVWLQVAPVFTDGLTAQLLLCLWKFGQGCKNSSYSLTVNAKLLLNPLNQNAESLHANHILIIRSEIRVVAKLRSVFVQKLMELTVFLNAMNN